MLVLQEDEDSEKDLSYSSLYLKRGKCVLLIRETSIEFLYQDVSRYLQFSHEIQE